MKALDVIAGKSRWSADCADAVEWLSALPDDSVDLLFTSPPYELARTYGIKDKMVGGQKWVDWMVAVVKAAAPKVKGLIAINCEGQTRGYRYSCVPFLLMADLHRAGFNLRKPPVFHRVGIPGSGGPDWLRNDYEPIVCVTRTGKLPWSNNIACGHPPKWMPGGKMTNRTKNGKRVHEVKMCDRGNGYEAQSYTVPDIANPGNRIERTYTASEVTKLLSGQGDLGSDLVSVIVGGGKMGNSLSAESEAPFPVELPAFFIKSFCPPDGICCDPFAGSGTTIDAAVQHGRRGIGCDIRQSQIDLTCRRMATVTPALFTEGDAA